MAEPITNICIVDKKSNCPPQYVLIDRTSEGEDADLWKDGLFRSKVTRYICYTRSITVNQWNHIATNVILIGMRDAVPQGYTTIRETIDTKESALRKHVLCVQFTPKSSTTSGITDLCVTKTDAYKSQQYTGVGEVNGINICFKLTLLPKVVSCRPAPPPPVERQTVSTLGSSPPPVPRRPALSVRHSAPNSGKDELTGITGVPFKLHDRFLLSNTSNGIKDDLNIKIRTKSELDETFKYDFTKERDIIMRQVNVMSL